MNITAQLAIYVDSHGKEEIWDNSHGKEEIEDNSHAKEEIGGLF